MRRFYLFDEIDANLDAAHRTAVANLIQSYTNQAVDDEEGGCVPPAPPHQDCTEQKIDLFRVLCSSPAQFIATTFRPELVTSADKCYGVSLKNKCSFVTEIDDETALQFITHEQRPTQRKHPASFRASQRDRH